MQQKFKSITARGLVTVVAGFVVTLSGCLSAPSDSRFSLFGNKFYVVPHDDMVKLLAQQKPPGDSKADALVKEPTSTPRPNDSRLETVEARDTPPQVRPEGNSLPGSENQLVDPNKMTAQKQPLVGSPHVPGVYGYPPGPSNQTPPPRQRPTAIGQYFGLNPDESTMTQAIALAAKLEEYSYANKELIHRLGQLEEKATQREQALNEALREVTRSNQEVEAARGSLQKLREEIEALKAQMKKMEEEDIEMMKAMIEALETMLSKGL